jgi:cytochrome c biogenesis protein CcmG/thiol:disulfide interchange protein DsbE
MNFNQAHSTTLPDEPPPRPRHGFSPGSIALLAGIVLIASIFGIALERRNQGQPTSGPAPDFVLKTFDGEEFRLSSQRGKVVVINFWASWCIPCREEAPILQRIWERYRQRGVIVTGVAYADTDQNSRDFIQEFALTYPNGPDLGTRISDTYRIQGIPETFVVDQNGDIARFIYGPVTEIQLNTILDNLLTGVQS